MGGRRVVFGCCCDECGGCAAHSRLEEVALMADDQRVLRVHFHEEKQ